jgi:NADP-dependent 3-hydroxy acid dehydrogenase YdfG
MKKIYFITGASSGFGRSLAEAVLQRGDCAVLTARRAAALEALAQQFPETALPIAMDVTNREQREAAVRSALDRFGRVDVLVNNAGQGSLGAIEEFSREQIRAQMEVNFFGAVDLTLALLPTMRAQGSGHIVNVSSIGGLVSMGGFALYCASKFALEGFSEGLRDEVKPLGITSRSWNPAHSEPSSAAMRTCGLSSRSPPTIPCRADPAVSIRQQRQTAGRSGEAALAMIAAVESDDPPLRLMLGADAYGLWEKKRTALDAELEKWRDTGINTAFEGVNVGAIGLETSGRGRASAGSPILRLLTQFRTAVEDSRFRLHARRLWAGASCWERF